MIAPLIKLVIIFVTTIPAIPKNKKQQELLDKRVTDRGDRISIKGPGPRAGGPGFLSCVKFNYQVKVMIDTALTATEHGPHTPTQAKG